MLYVPSLLNFFLFRLEAMAISWSAMFHVVILSWLGPRQHFQGSITIPIGLVRWCRLALPTKQVPPIRPGGRNGSCLAPGAGIRTRSSVHVGTDSPRHHPANLACTTHVTRLNSRPPVNNSPCLRYTTLDPHHGAYRELTTAQKATWRPQNESATPA